MKRQRAAAILALTLLAGSCTPIAAWYGHDATRTWRATVRERDGQQWVEMEGRALPRYEAVGFSELVIASGHVAYPARIQGEWHVVRDDAVGPAWESIGDVAFSDDAAHLAYVAFRGSRAYVVAEGTSSRAWDAVVADTLAMGPTGKHSIYAAMRDGEVYVVIDDVEAGPFASVSRTRVDDQRASYTYRTDAGAFAVIGDARVGPYASIVSLDVRSNGRWALHARDEDGSDHVVVDGRTVEGTEHVADDSVRVAPSAAVYVESFEGSSRVVTDGLKGPWFERVETPTTTRAHYGYIGHSEGASAVVVDGRTVATEPFATSLVLAEDCAAFAYAAHRDENVVVIGERAFPFERIVVDTLVLTPDGAHWACIVERGNDMSITIDGTRNVAFDRDELAATYMGHDRDAMMDGAFLARWVRAELVRATR